MLIGEAPGREEDRFGEPFVGESGQALNFIIHKAGWIREHLFITNAVRCRPPENRKPLKVEIVACREYLHNEIAKVKPAVIITLGAVALSSLFDKLALKNNLLRMLKFKNSIVIPTIHPARALNSSKSALFGWIEAAFVIANNLLNDRKYIDVDRESLIVRQPVNLPVAEKYACDYEEVNNIVGYGIYTKKKHYFFLNGNIPQLKPILENFDAIKIVYSAPHETNFLKRYNIDLKNTFDLYPAFYLYNENYPSYSLKFASAILLGVPDYSVDFSKDIKLEELVKYNLKDCYYTYILQNKILKQLKQNNLLNLYYNLALPLSRIMFDLHKNGMLVDRDKLELRLQMISRELETMQQFFSETIKKDFNPKSTKQLQEILKQLNLSTGEQTPSGKMSTNKNALIKIQDNQIVSAILKFRALEKQKEVLENLKEKVSEDGRIHSHYIFGTETGRLSSFDLNMQNIAPGLRDLFIVPPKHIFVKLDFSQIELRVLAFVSQDKKLIKAFSNPETDIHSYVASLVFKKQSPKYRTFAKKIVFGLIYGMGINRLAKELNIKPEIAKRYRNKILKMFSALKNFQDECIVKLNVYKQLVNPFGRKRRFEYMYNDRAAGDAVREAINFMVQSTASDIVQFFFISIYDELQRNGIKMINFVHDEGDFELPENLYSTFQDIVSKGAQNFKKLLKDKFNMDLNVTLAIEEAVGQNWMDVKKTRSYVIR